MRTVKAYYDGKTFVPMQNYTFRPHQQVLIVVDEHENETTVAQQFLQLSWAGDETADEILTKIVSNHANTKRFGEENALFD